MVLSKKLYVGGGGYGQNVTISYDPNLVTSTYIKSPISGCHQIIYDINTIESAKFALDAVYASIIEDYINKYTPFVTLTVWSFQDVIGHLERTHTYRYTYEPDTHSFYMYVKIVKKFIGC